MDCRVGRGLLKIWVAVFIAAAVAFPFSGCSSRTKIDTVETVSSVDSAGNPVQTVTETNIIKAENATVIEALAPIMKQCVGDIEKEDSESRKKELLDLLPAPADCSKATFSGSQTTCYDKNAQITTTLILGISLNTALRKDENLESPQAFCARQAAAIAKSYHDKEAQQAGAWKAVGLTTAIALPAAWVFTRGMDMLGTMAAGQGDHITTGDNHFNNSNDPSADTGGSAGGNTGGQAVVFGSGGAATDQGQSFGKAVVVDKNQNTDFKDAESNLDGSGSPSGVVLSDDGDGANNEFGLVTP